MEFDTIKALSLALHYRMLWLETQNPLPQPLEPTIEHLQPILNAWNGKYCLNELKMIVDRVKSWRI